MFVFDKSLLSLLSFNQMVCDAQLLKTRGYPIGKVTRRKKGMGHTFFRKFGQRDWREVRRNRQGRWELVPGGVRTSNSGEELPEDAQRHSDPWEKRVHQQANLVQGALDVARQKLLSQRTPEPDAIDHAIRLVEDAHREAAKYVHDLAALGNPEGKKLAAAARRQLKGIGSLSTATDLQQALNKLGKVWEKIGDKAKIIADAEAAKHAAAVTARPPQQPPARPATPPAPARVPTPAPKPAPAPVPENLYKPKDNDALGQRVRKAAEELFAFETMKGRQLSIDEKDILSSKLRRAREHTLEMIRGITNGPERKLIGNRVKEKFGEVERTISGMPGSIGRLVQLGQHDKAIDALRSAAVQALEGLKLYDEGAVYREGKKKEIEEQKKHEEEIQRQEEERKKQEEARKQEEERRLLTDRREKIRNAPPLPALKSQTGIQLLEACAKLKDIALSDEPVHDKHGMASEIRQARDAINTALAEFVAADPAANEEAKKAKNLLAPVALGGVGRQVDSGKHLSLAVSLFEAAQHAAAAFAVHEREEQAPLPPSPAHADGPHLRGVKDWIVAKSSFGNNVWDAPGADIKKILEAIDTPSKGATFLGGGIQPSFKLETEGGAECVFKPDELQSKRGRAEVTQGMCELAAFLIDRAIGLGMTPPVAMRNGYLPKSAVDQLRHAKGIVASPRKAYGGAGMMFISGMVNAMNKGGSSRYLTKALTNPDMMFEFQKMAILDYVIGHQDNHDGNWMVSQDMSKIIAVDHGFAFSDDPSGRISANSWPLRELRGGGVANIDPRIMQMVSRVDQGALLQELIDLGMEPEGRGAIARLNEVIASRGEFKKLKQIRNF